MQSILGQGTNNELLYIINYITDSGLQLICTTMVSKPDSEKGNQHLRDTDSFFSRTWHLPTVPKLLVTLLLNLVLLCLIGQSNHLTATP